jgi:lantibiotic modifying enzyme
VGAVLILAGKEIGDDQALADGLSLLMALPTHTDDPYAMDLVSGMAGTVLAMAVASTALGQDRELCARADQAAEFLLQCGSRGPDGTLSWLTMPNCRANLTGFAHGTSGIAHALLTLAAIAPGRDFEAAAMDAIAYENAAFDPVRRNWPDYRFQLEHAQNEPSFPVAWCHGTAGIVRCRLTAAASNIDVSSDVEAGIAAIVEVAKRWSRVSGADFTLCHGFLGLTDTLLECTRANWGDHGELIAEMVASTVDWFHDGRPWPSGLPGREPAQGIMLGSAGIGHFFLRLADPTLESVLAPGSFLFRS